jgi:hypothetical protein
MKELGGRRQIEMAAERAASTSSERVHGAVAQGLTILGGGKRKDTNRRASVYRLKHTSNGS